MMTVLESLTSLSSYPIGKRILQNIADKRELKADEDITAAIRLSKSYQLAEADVYEFLSGAPSVSQGGISYSFTAEQQKGFRALSHSIKVEQGEAKTKYGYKGSRL